MVVAVTSRILRNKYFATRDPRIRSFVCELGCISSLQVLHIHFHGCLPDFHSSHWHSGLPQLSHTQAPQGSSQPHPPQTPSQKANHLPQATFLLFSDHSEHLSNPLHLLNHGSRKRMRCSMKTVLKPRGRPCECPFCVHLRQRSTIRWFLLTVITWKGYMKRSKGTSMIIIKLGQQEVVNSG